MACSKNWLVSFHFVSFSVSISAFTTCPVQFTQCILCTMLCTILRTMLCTVQCTMLRTKIKLALHLHTDKLWL